VVYVRDVFLSSYAITLSFSSIFFNLALYQSIEFKESRSIFGLDGDSLHSSDVAYSSQREQVFVTYSYSILHYDWLAFLIFGKGP